MSPYLTQIILNTGQISKNPVKALHPLLYAELAPVLHTGFGPILARPDFTVSLGHGVDSTQMSFGKQGYQVIAGVACWGTQDEMGSWHWLVALLDSCGGPADQVPLQPPECPWVGLVLLPEIKRVTPEEIEYLEAFASLLTLAAFHRRFRLN